MKILFITDNFPPEVNAPATRTFEHCIEWVRQGFCVTVITGVPNFPQGEVFKGYKNKLYQKEIIDGIEVIRVWTYIAENKGFVKRILDYLSFMLSSFLAGLFVKADIIIATSPQFFTAISGRWLSFWKRRPWVMEVRDLWPESIKAVGAMETNIFIRFFEILEKRMYKRASKIVVVTDAFKEELIVKHGISPRKIAVVKNGANMDLFVPQSKNQSLLGQFGLKNKFVIGYIGTHGMAHALDFILRSAKHVKDDNIHFLFIGSGAKKQELLDLKEQLGLNNVTMLDLVPKEEVKEYISIMDVSLVNLKKSDTFKSVIPSKIFENVAMHKPILLGVEGESKRIIEDYGVGEVFEPENEKDFLNKMYKMFENPQKYNENFNNLLKDFDRKALADKMLQFLRE
ncbi:glycosyltransferase family 4 protein [Gaetbulibacter saemankumensis]|uniref:glycosyltransferase family 4 protein n=1 Tax=Gaetbulibacter saemankumensis TaxID=311208 RepID=UPI0003F8570F|nr:glycosyltransferase family 4 protein [Gaetbulibacter saemankumensis]